MAIAHSPTNSPQHALQAWHTTIECSVSIIAASLLALRAHVHTNTPDRSIGSTAVLFLPMMHPCCLCPHNPHEPQHSLFADIICWAHCRLQACSCSQQIWRGCSSTHRVCARRGHHRSVGGACTGAHAFALHQQAAVAANWGAYHPTDEPHCQPVMSCVCVAAAFVCVCVCS